jgi:transcription initiation factor TFIID TATA-box-binding protein
MEKARKELLNYLLYEAPLHECDRRNLAELHDTLLNPDTKVIGGQWLVGPQGLEGMGSSRPEIRIVNIVATAKLNHRLDLDTICKAFPTAAHYRPEQFPGLCFRLKKPKTSTLIFGSGAMVCTGALSTAQARLAIRRVVGELRGKGVVIPDNPKAHVQNIVASVNMGGAIDLVKAVYALGKTIYEPEQFPGVIHRMEEPRVVFLIFANGKLVVAGAKKTGDTYTAVDKLQRRLKEAGLISYGRLTPSTN